VVLIGALGVLVYLGRDPGAPPSTPARLVAIDAAREEAAASNLTALTWPDEPVAGPAAKARLLRVLEAATRRLEALSGYTATLVRQERLGGKLGPEQTIHLKVRHAPFAVYLHFLEPDAGKEAIFAEGFHDDDVVAHGGGLTKLVLPHIKVPPTSAVAMAGNRHPITEAGLLSLTRKLLRYRQLDMVDDDAETVLDRLTDADGREWLRSVHNHDRRSPDRPFAYVEVLYDPGTKLPHQICSYDWPQGGSGDRDRPLAERYQYEDLVLDPPLSDLDFDYRNPAYGYRRF
jgi:hypothetical protein